MKLRNKETYELFEAITFDYINSGKPNGNGDYPVEFVTLEVVDEEGDLYEFRYKSLKDLNAAWEDYTPAEPLIKDENIRKAVRAWSEVNSDKKVRYDLYSNEFYVNDSEGYVIRSLKFKFEVKDVIGLDSGNYTITELCGEEEE